MKKDSIVAHLALETASKPVSNYTAAVVKWAMRLVELNEIQIMYENCELTVKSCTCLI